MRPDGGYNGSSYVVTHDPVSDALKDVHYQAVARQSHVVHFVRATVPAQ